MCCTVLLCAVLAPLFLTVITISERSAAHCVTINCNICQPEATRPSEVKVALGKVHRDWSSREEHQVQRSVIKILLEANFRGSATNLARDIAVLTLDTEVEVSSFIMPVCLDLDNNHFGMITLKTNPGYVAVWGETVNCTAGKVCPVSDSLQYTRTNVHFFHECLDLIQRKNPTIVPRLSSDKLCTEYGKDSVVQKEHSGGGLVFRFGRLHFIYGVFSVRLKFKDDHSIGTFTNVSEYMSWITRNIS